MEQKSENVSFKFENLRIWQDSMSLTEDIFKISSRFPKEEMYHLSSQIRRASDSIALNISEGSILQSSPEQRKFLGYSIRSIAEVVTCLHKAKRRKYLDDDSFQTFYMTCFDLMNMTIAYRNKLN